MSTSGAVHLMSAFAGQARWLLAQQAVAEKANEISAIPDQLGLLDRQGAVVSIDAMGCQKTIAHRIVEAGADDVLALKEGHPSLCEDGQLCLDTEIAQGRLLLHETVEKDHERVEIRRYALSVQIDWLEGKLDWAGLQAFGRVESTRLIGDQASTECRYFRCSLPGPERFAATVRGHWGTENQQHWVLDIQFGEDACRTRQDHSAENLALIRRMALNVLRRNGPARDSIRRREPAPRSTMAIDCVYSSAIRARQPHSAIALVSYRDPNGRSGRATRFRLAPCARRPPG
jgi:predicted transposase YbfD/YdcC